MILAIDCGNTHTTVGIVDGACTVRSVFRIPTDRRETDFGYAAKIGQILKMQDVTAEEIRGIALSCVVPPIADVLVRAARHLTGKEALVVGAGVKTGLPLAVNDPGTVASDLVVAAVAARADYPLPCLIVDLGTATTLSALDAGGRFIGCAILPGAEISLRALAEETALLPHVEIRAPRSPIGTSTADCMRAGTVFGTAGAVDGLIDRFAGAMGTPPASIVATGGLAAAIAPHCKHMLQLDETLLLRGLRRIWDKNQK